MKVYDVKIGEECLKTFKKKKEAKKFIKSASVVVLEVFKEKKALIEERNVSMNKIISKIKKILEGDEK